MNIYLRYLLRDLARRPVELLRQLLFLIPAMAIPLFLILVAYLPYINQWVYLSSMQYEGYEYVNRTEEGNSWFLRSKSMSFAEKSDDGKLAVRRVESLFFDKGEDFDFEFTPFAPRMIVEGKNARELEIGEAIVSKNVAQSLDVHVGDMILLSGDDGLYSKARQYRLVGLTKPKYSYGDIGKRWGIALARDVWDEVAPTVSSSVRFDCSADNVRRGDGDCVSLFQERREATNPVGQKGPYLFLTLATVLMIVLIMSREASHRFELARNDIGLLIALGADRKRLLLWLAAEELFVMLISTAMALLLLRAVFAWRVFELTLSWSVMLAIFTALALVELLLVFWFYSRKKVRVALDGTAVGLKGRVE